MPKSVDDRLPFGAPKLVLLSALNASMRNSSRESPSPRPKSLCSPRSSEVDRRPARDVPRRVAERLRAVGRNDDVVPVEVVVDRAIAVDVADEVRTVGRRGADRERRRGRVAQVHGKAARHRVDRSQAPAADDALEDRAQVVRPSAIAAEGQLPDDRRRVVDRLVVARGPPLAVEVTEVDAAVVAIGRFEVARRVVFGLGPGEGIEEIQPARVAALHLHLHRVIAWPCRRRTPPG